MRTLSTSCFFCVVACECLSLASHGSFRFAAASLSLCLLHLFLFFPLLKYSDVCLVVVVGVPVSFHAAQCAAGRAGRATALAAFRAFTSHIARIDKANAAGHADIAGIGEATGLTVIAVDRLFFRFS